MEYSTLSKQHMLVSCVREIPFPSRNLVSIYLGLYVKLDMSKIDSWRWMETVGYQLVNTAGFNADSTHLQMQVRHFATAGIVVS